MTESVYLKLDEEASKTLQIRLVEGDHLPLKTNFCVEKSTIVTKRMTTTAQGRATLLLLKELQGKLSHQRHQPTTTMFEEDNDEDENDWRKDEEELKGLLLAISSLVGPKLMDKALEISSRRQGVSEFRATCGRSMFRVRGDKGAEYKVLLVGYCNCFNFLNDRCGTSLPICKHILAAYLARAQNTAEIHNVKDEDWGRIAWGV